MVRTNSRPALWLTTGVACCTVLACGGGAEEDAVASGGEARRALAQAPAGSQQAVSQVYPPVEPGKRRVSQLIIWPLAERPSSHHERAEAAVSSFDVLGIPVDLIDCGFPLESHHPIAEGMIRIILDVREQDLEVARELGFEEFSEQLPPVIIFQNCESGPSVAFQRIQGYAKRLYPDLFMGFGLFNTYEQFSYRRYENGNYLGVVGDEVYVHNGRDWNFLYVGKIQDFIPFIDGIPKSQPASQ